MATADLPVSGEALLAAVGVRDLVSGDPVRITADHRERAGRLPLAFERSIRAFLTSPELDEPADPPPADLGDVLDDLAEPESEEDLAARLTGLAVDPEAAADFGAAAGRALRHLRAASPRREHKSPTGPERVEASDSDMGRFARTYHVVEDPLTVLVDLRQGDLTPGQVRTLEAVYPGLYEEMRAILTQLMIEIRAKRKSWRLAHEKDKALQVFLQTRTVDSRLAAELAKAHTEAEPQERRARPQASSKSVEAVSTPIQRISAK